MTSGAAPERPTGRQLPPPKPKQQGYRPPTQLQGGEEQPADQADEAASQPEPVSPTPLRSRAPAEAVGATRVTIYSDARIEHWLNEVRVQAAIARLDLTHSAVWRRAMYDLMNQVTPHQLVGEFQSQRQRTDSPRPGRPRR